MLARYRLHLLLIATFAIAVLLTTVANQLAGHLIVGPAEAENGESVSTEVRINAKRLDNGVVEFGLQQWDGSAWGERLLPSQRFFSPGTEVDRWLSSSPVELAVAVPVVEPMPVAEPVATEEPGPRPTLCVVVDGDSTALVWQFTALNAPRAADLLGLDLEYSSHPDAEARVAAIEKCVEDEVQMILSTLADPDMVIPALQDAAAQGIKIASFGAGGDHADRAGSLIHVSLDEAAAGRRAAEQLESLGVSGLVLCLFDEGDRQGRQRSCDSLAEHYESGEVLPVPFSLNDPRSEIATILSLYVDVAGLIVVEADFLPAALEAMTFTGVEPVLGAIGEYPLSRLRTVDRDRIAFTVTDLARFEALLSAAALHLMYRYHPNARFFEGAMLFDGAPNVHTGGPTGGPRPVPEDDDGQDQ